jgi:hypothetical protein
MIFGHGERIYECCGRCEYEESLQKSEKLYLCILLFKYRH